MSEAGDGWGESSDGEIVDVVDDDDRVVGQATRAEVRDRLLRHRFACVVCRNSAGQIYVHRRSSRMDVFPDHHDTMVAGHVRAGESYEAAAERELGEELGITGVPLRLVLRDRYDHPEVRSWSTVYEARWDGPVVHQESEIAWGAWMEESEVVAKLDEWSFTPDGLHAFRRYLRST